MALLVRVGTVTLWLGPELSQSGLEARLRAIPVAPQRGMILDALGNVLAGSQALESLYAIPAQVANPGRTAELLAPVLGMREDTLNTLLSRRVSVVWIKKRLTTEQATHVKALALPGLGLIGATKRSYPEGSLGARVIGFTGIDNQGLDGVELTYNKFLAGRAGAIRVELDARNRPIPGVKEYFQPPVAGDNLVLTMQMPIEKIAVGAAESALRQTGAVSVGIIVMDVKTGGILAVVSVPGYSPANYASYPQKVRRDPMVSDTFPPGSTFKIVTAAAALESRVASIHSYFFDPGSRVVSGVRLFCHRKSGHGSLSFTDIVHQSCNVGFIDLGLRLGTDRFYQFLSRFNLVKPTGIDLPGEASGIVPPVKRVTPVDLATMAFGQTLSVTPIQLVSAVAAIADGGIWNQPHVMSAILSPAGKVLERWSVNGKRVVSPQVASQLSKILGGVVSEGTGKKGRVKGYSLAGKTGTAQAVIDGRYVQGKYVASFVGFGPLPDPQVAVLVLINQPQGMYYGGQIAAPVFSRVMAQTLNLLDVEPTVDLSKVSPVPDVTGLSFSDATTRLNKAGLSARIIGSGGKTLDQFPPAGTTLPHGAEVFLFGEMGKEAVVPDLVGLDVSQALKSLDAQNLRARLIGSGKIVRQDPAAGNRVPSGTTVSIWAEPPITSPDSKP